MKKLIALLLVLAMVFVFVGCEPASEEQTQSTEGTNSAEETETSDDASEPVVEQEQPQAQVSLKEALSNTMEAIEGGNLTVTLQGGYELMREPVAGFVNGYSIPMEGQYQIVVDREEENVSIYGTVNSSSSITTYVIHDGWEVNGYYKVDKSEDLEKLFEDPQEISLMDLFDQMPEEDLAEMEAVINPDKLAELLESLVAEKFGNEQWINSTFDYTCSAENGELVHTYSIDMITLIETVFGHFEGAFVDNNAFLDTMDEIEDLSKQMEDAVLSLRLIQSGDSITGFGLCITVGASKNETQIKAELIITISEIGTTEIDEEMLDAIVDEIPELDAFEDYEDYYDYDYYS